MRTVLIVETKTGKQIASYPIVLKGMNYAPSDADYFKEAWRCATDDKLVDPSRKEDYLLSFVQ
jgi:hypothetical protein